LNGRTIYRSFGAVSSASKIVAPLFIVLMVSIIRFIWASTSALTID